MTAVDLDALDKLRGALADAIPGWVGLTHDEPGLLADALLPVVDRIANERAAAELRKAADWYWDDHDPGRMIHDDLQRRAHALDGKP